MRLYYSKNSNPRLAVAVAKHLKSPVEFILASPQHVAHKEAFKALNPNALVPVLEEDGKTLWETDAIACRLSAIAKSDFWRTGQAQPDMIRWISWATQHLNRAADPLYFFRIVWPTFMSEAPPQSKLDEGLKNFVQHAAVLDQYLAHRQWLVDDKVSYADFRAATFLPFAEKSELPLSDFPNISRWHNQLMQLPAWSAPFDGLET
jgi:glutathione S-transferase